MGGVFSARPRGETGSMVKVIAEAGVNHNGSAELARRLVDEACSAGADAVKFQSFRTNRLVSRRAEMADYQKRNEGREGSQASMLEKLELDAKTFGDLAEHARQIGVEFLSTPFDEESLAMLVDLGVRRMKLGSGDVTNAPMLRAVARTGLPLILSTGMSTLGEIEAALALLAAAYLEAEGGGKVPPVEALCSRSGQALLNERVTLLHCTTEYPAPFDQTNLLAMGTLRSAFGLPVGYSDHTEGFAISLAATALGATVIEKHFTVDRKLPGPDHAASLEPLELETMIQGVRAIELAMGRTLKLPGAAERANLKVARRSLVAGVKIAKGTTITSAMLDVKRPGDGVSPMRIDEVVGRPASRDYEPDDPIVI
jgi:N-acetylneuraminate synthase